MGTSRDRQANVASLRSSSAGTGTTARRSPLQHETWAQADNPYRWIVHLEGVENALDVGLFGEYAPTDDA